MSDSPTVTHLSPDGAVLNDEGGFVIPIDTAIRANKAMDAHFTGVHKVKFTHSQTVFRYPPESFIKKLKRFFGIKPKGSPFVKLEDKE